MLRLVAASCLVVLFPAAWLVAGGDSRLDDNGPCLPRAGPPPSANPSPAVIVLIGGDAYRLVRISLPGGRIQRERTLGGPLPEAEAGDRELFRLGVASGPALALTPGNESVVALVRKPAPGPDSVAVLDSATLRTRCTHRLERDVRYTGLLLGRSGLLYAYGTRRAEGGRDAVLSIVDAGTGELAGSRTLHEPEHPEGRDWFPYAGALSRDGRHLVVSYHGGDTTGADWLRAPAGPFVSPSDPKRTDASVVHGAVEPLANGFLATTGSRLVEFDRDGNLVRRLQPHARNVHLMDFALDERGRFAYVSSCGKRPAIHRLDVDRERLEVMPSGGFCGVPLAVHGERLLLAATTVGRRLGYSRGPWPPEVVRLIDLEDTTAGGRPLLTGRPLDAVVVREP